MRRSVLGLFFWTVCGTICAVVAVGWVWGVVANCLTSL